MTLPDIDPTPSYLVFGATGGIGSELCRHLAAQGARLVLAGRNEKKLRTPSEELHGFAYPLDATHFEEVDGCAFKSFNCKPDWTVSLAVSDRCCSSQPTQSARPNGGPSSQQT